MATRIERLKQRFATDGPWALVAGSIGLAALAALLGVYYLNARAASVESELRARYEANLVEVVVPQVDLAKGDIVVERVMAVRRVPAAYVHSDAVRPGDFARAEGQRLALSVGEGKPLMWTMLEDGKSRVFSELLPEGYRALTIQVDEVNSISGMLRPGDRIDLLVSYARGGDERVVTLLADVPVLATGQIVRTNKSRYEVFPAAGNDEGDLEQVPLGQRRYSSITIALPVDEVHTVLLAERVGRLTAVLRGSADPEKLAAGAAGLGLEGGEDGGDAAYAAFGLPPVGAGPPGSFAARREAGVGAGAATAAEALFGLDPGYGGGEAIADFGGDLPGLGGARLRRFSERVGGQRVEYIIGGSGGASQLEDVATLGAPPAAPPPPPAPAPSAMPVGYVQ